MKRFHKYINEIKDPYNIYSLLLSTLPTNSLNVLAYNEISSKLRIETTELKTLKPPPPDTHTHMNISDCAFHLELRISSFRVFVIKCFAMYRMSVKGSVDCIMSFTTNMH